MVKHNHRGCEPREIPCDIVGKRRFSVWDCVFEVDARFRLVKCIGKGAYGMVCSAVDDSTGLKVAIKKIARPLANRTNALRCLREINLLRQLDHPKIVKIKGVLKPASYDEELKDVYVLYECMDTDLHQIIRSRQALSDDHLKFFIMQTLQGVKYLHSMDIIHRDLKPSNLLVNADCDLRIADFGLSRSRHSRCDMTQYVVTRWYRAPEVLMFQPYSFKADLWSIGCILGEFLQSEPLFPGNGGLQTLKQMVELVGRPSPSDMAHLGKSEQSYLSTLPDLGNKIEVQFPEVNHLCRDLLKSLLQFNPDRRPTAEEALAHPWFDSLRDQDEDDIVGASFNYDFDEDGLSSTQIRQLIVSEMEYWNRSN